jgi:hypothetical protein
LRATAFEIGRLAGFEGAVTRRDRLATFAFGATLTSFLAFGRAAIRAVFAVFAVFWGAFLAGFLTETGRAWRRFTRRVAFARRLAGFLAVFARFTGGRRPGRVLDLDLAAMLSTFSRLVDLGC